MANGLNIPRKSTKIVLDVIASLEYLMGIPSWNIIQDIMKLIMQTISQIMMHFNMQIIMNVVIQEIIQFVMNIGNLKLIQIWGSSHTRQIVFYVAKNVYDVPRLHKTCFMLPWGRVWCTKAA